MAYQAATVPLLAKIAYKLLAIPATSAPTERVFSVAGITIAKERAQLNPEHAGELIFLHDATPAIIFLKTVY